MNITEIIRAYTTGDKTLDEANAALKEAGSGLQLDPARNVITEAERKTHGLLDTGTGTLDKVEVKDGRIVGCDCGEMYALCIFDGKTYQVKGTALEEV